MGPSHWKEAIVLSTASWLTTALGPIHPLATDHSVHWGLRSFLGRGTSNAKIRKVLERIFHPLLGHSTLY